MVRLLTFGKIDLRDGSASELESVLRAPKQLALLTYLAASTPLGFHRRDTLLALLWPEFSGERARRALRKALYQLRQALGADALKNRGEEEITLAEGALWCDAAAFENHLEAGRLQEALKLYRGEFLKGFHLSGCGDFERWLEDARTRFKQRAVDAAWELVEQQERDGNGAEAVQWAQWAMALSPTDEGAFQRLARVFDRCGDRSNALQAYDELVARLREEYDVEPSPETRELIGAIRDRKGTNGAALPAARPQAESLARPAGPSERSVLRLGRLSIGRSRRFAALAAGLAVVIGGFAVVRNGRRDTARVLVSVFENRTGDSTLNALGSMAADWITRGLAETEIITAVSPVTTLRFPPVIISHSIASEVPPAARALAESMDATIVVWGAYYGDGDSIRVEAAVAPLQTDARIRVLEPVTVEASNPVATIEILRQRVIEALAQSLNSRLALWIRQEKAPPDYRAYEAYLEGIDRAWLRRAGYSPSGGLPHFIRAASLDSGFTAAMLEVALMQWHLGRNDAVDSILEVVRRISAGRIALVDSVRMNWIETLTGSEPLQWYHAVRRVSELFPTEPSILGQRIQSAQQIGRWRESIEILEQIDPFGPEGDRYMYFRFLSKAHHRLGNHEQELIEARRGREQYPAEKVYLRYELRALAALGRWEEMKVLLDWEAVGQRGGWGNVGSLMLVAGQELMVHGNHEAASDLFRGTVDQFDRFPVAGSRIIVAIALYHLQQWERVEPLLHPDSNHVFDLGYAGMVAARTGEREKASEFSGRLAAHDTYRAFSYRAAIAAHLGEREQALRFLEDAIELGANQQWLHRELEPEFESIKDHPTYRELMGPRG
jgi:DNA-binding SARP family transcriptional activator